MIKSVVALSHAEIPPNFRASKPAAQTTPTALWGDPIDTGYSWRHPVESAGHAIEGHFAVLAQHGEFTGISGGADADGALTG